jgi:hypothetical protein
VAEPKLLRDAALAQVALSLHKRILDRVLQASDRASGPFRTLRQGLGYTASVVVQALPDDGFPWLARLAETQDRDALWIVRENLRRKRLLKAFPARVEALAGRLCVPPGGR